MTHQLSVVREISRKHDPLKYKEDLMQIRKKCSCRRKGCNPNTPMFAECKGSKIYFESFRHKGKFYGRSLNTGKEKEAIVELALRFRDLERGLSPKLNKPFKEVLEDYYFWAIDESQKSDSALKDIKGRVRANLAPAFGDYKISEITQARVKQYKSDREEEGAAKGTIKKELDILKDIIHLFDPSFIMPKFKRWANPGKKVLTALTLEEVLAVGGKVAETSPQFGEIYCNLFWLMAFTGLDVSDALFLKKSEIVDNCIFKDRGKTNKKITAYLVPEARKLLDNIQVIDISGRLFIGPKSKAVSTAIMRAFKKAGIKGNAKALRHFAATLYKKAGLSKANIRKILGHAVASRIVDDYIHDDMEIMDRAYEGLKPTGLLEKAGVM